MRNGRLAKIRQIRLWLARTVKENKDKRDKKIFDLWLACWTQEEIAEREQMTRQAVALIMQEMAELPKLAKSDKSTAEHADDFTPPLYNMVNHFLVSPCRW